MAAKLSTRLITLLSILLPLACGDALGPGDIAGTYALRRVAGDTLPAVLYTTGTVTVRVFADTLRFALDHRGAQITVRESDPVAGGPSGGPVHWESLFTFRIVEGRIEVGYDCPPGADCVAPPHLVLRPIPNGLQADFALGGRLPLIYERVD
jgi:hypothetical protein